VERIPGGMIASLREDPRWSVFRQYIKFCIVGFANLGVQTLVYTLLTRLLSFFARHDTTALAIAFVFAVTNSYIWNSIWVFRSRAIRQGSRSGIAFEYTKFMVVSIIGLVITASTFNFGKHVLHLDRALLLWAFHLGGKLVRVEGDYASLMISAVVVSIWNFSANRFWTFRH